MIDWRLSRDEIVWVKILGCERERPSGNFLSTLIFLEIIVKEDEEETGEEEMREEKKKR